MSFNYDIIRQYFPIGDKYPPALTIGLIIFLPFLYLLNFVISINDSIALYPLALTELDLNRISLYPLGHLSLFHVLFNLIAILTPLAQFERRYGTVYTGVILNLFAVTTALPFSILGLIFYPNTRVLGASAWVFSFSAFFAFKESLIKPSFQITPTYSLPTIYTPFVPLIVIAILVPGSSFLGHLFGLLSGYAFAFGYLDKLVPPSKVIEWIEEKLDKLINLIPTPFKYYREVAAKHLRAQEDYTSFLPHASVPIGETTNQSQPPSGFQGSGHVLGA